MVPPSDAMIYSDDSACPRRRHLQPGGLDVLPAAESTRAGGLPARLVSRRDRDWRAYLSGDTRQGRFGIGYAALRAASTGTPAAAPALSLVEVDRRLQEISAMRGSGAAAQRAHALRELFSLATGTEQPFLIRLLAGELRQGALEGVMIDAIAAAAGLQSHQIRRAAMYSRNLARAARVALLEGAEGLTQFQLETLSPIAPMLAQTAGDPGEALEQLHGEVAFEWKMDGARIQAHKSADLVRIFSRSLNDVTAAIPEIAESLRALPVNELILDGEAIVLDPAGRPVPFQVTMRRFGRKLDVQRLRTELPIRAFFFDCLRLEDASLSDRPARERFEALGRAVPAALIIPRLLTNSEREAQDFYDAALAAGHEGLMAKSLDAPY